MAQALLYYSYLLHFGNGSPQWFFEGRTGLRHGDPISPQLLVMVMEILASLLKTGLERNCFKSHQLKITHISFADGVLLFFKGEKESMLAIKEILRVFSRNTCLMLNHAKIMIITGGLHEEV